MLRSQSWRSWKCFNLIMNGIEGYWDQSPAILSRDRIFEHTCKSLVDRFGGLDGRELDKMLNLPSMFAYECAVNSDAHIGRIIRLRKREREVRIDFEFDPAAASTTRRRRETTGMATRHRRFGSSIELTGQLKMSTCLRS